MTEAERMQVAELVHKGLLPGNVIVLNGLGHVGFYQIS